eukprot:14028911-Alexandrium_andersonii.AAC.1
MKQVHGHEDLRHAVRAHFVNLPRAIARKSLRALNNVIPVATLGGESVAQAGVCVLRHENIARAKSH